MKKALVLTFVFALITFAKAWSQTEPPAAAPTAKPAVPAKDKTEQMKKAEEKSGGAAYSGKGKGGDKDMVEKQKKHKAKHKAKKAKKAKKHKEGETPEVEKPGQPGDSPKPIEHGKSHKAKQPGDAPQPTGKQAPQPKKIEPKKKPTETTPKPKTDGGNKQ